MPPVIRIPDDIYEELDQRRTKPFQTPAEVIRSLLEQTSEKPVQQTVQQQPTQNQSTTGRKRQGRNTTLEEWKEHFEIVLGYSEGETDIGTPEWSRNIHKSLCDGEVAFGITATNAAEAILQVIKENTPDYYDNALSGMKATILEYRAKGSPLKKLAKMYNRVSGDSLDEDI